MLEEPRGLFRKGLGLTGLPPGPRLLALDHLRGFLVALVVLHHAMLAYCHFGHVDHRHYLLSTAPVVDVRQWLGFDVLVALNDAYFMPLMFLLSGLFVRRSLVRKGIWSFLKDRVVRLGMPFAVAVLTVVPLAYYPSWLQSGGAPGFLTFWTTMVTVGPWPSGPPWFVGMLLAFDTAAAVVLALLPRRQYRPVGRPFMPSSAFGLLLVGLPATYLPFLAAFGPSYWVSFGPFAIQASRIGLYAASFAAGVIFGTKALDEDESPFRAALIRRWANWVLVCVIGGTIFIGIQVAGFYFGGMMPNWLWRNIQGIALASFCAAACLALPALFLRLGTRKHRWWGRFAACSYGIYLLHYAVVIWIQYGLLDASLPAVIKVIITFVTSVLLCWTATDLLRRIPGVSQVV